jgi:hypothetical protein
MLSNISFGQNNSSITSFVNKFKQLTLPTCVEYSYEEQVYFGAVYHTDTVLIKEKDTSYYEIQEVYEMNNGYEKDTSSVLNRAGVKKYLLPPNDTSYYQWIHNKTDTTFADFYAVSLVCVTKDFYGVIYEKIFSNGGIQSSEKYLCTFGADGKFISRVLIASFIFNGTGMGFSGSRVPVFAYEHSCIGKDLLIKTYDEEINTDKYKIHWIDTGGQIKEIN